LSEDRSPTVSMIEAHEEFIQHIEDGSRKVRWLSAVTIVVALVLFASYAYQLVLPYATGTAKVTVNLTDPVLQATELAVAALTLLWLLVGVRDYRFTGRMEKAISEARALERDLEKRVSA